MRHQKAGGHFFIQLRKMGLVAAAAFGAALFSIYTRSAGPLSAFWPANALLLGLFIRDPKKTSLGGWISAAAGLLMADLLTGRDVSITLWLTAANLVGVLIGFLLFQRLSLDNRRLHRPGSILYLFAICVAASMDSAIVGGGAAPTLYGRGFVTGIGFWFTTEFVNYIIVLPVVLTVPAPPYVLPGKRRVDDWSWRDLKKATPILLFAISIVLAVVIGGPGAIAIPVPALLWCALNYDLALTVIMTLLFSIWQIHAASTTMSLQTVSGDPLKQMMSIRLGIALLALGPLTVASINAARNELLLNLDYAVNHDFLTKILARGAFMKLAGSLLFPGLPQKLSAVVLMLDIDHFKRVNDQYGHSVGDRALVIFASAVNSILREGDLFGRLGGEEFAIVLPKITQAEATEVAERIRCKVATTPVPLDDGGVLNITASIGVVHQGALSYSSLESILSASDQALYMAKTLGRNRIAYAGDSF